jgi:ferric-chelate reductase
MGVTLTQFAGFIALAQLPLIILLSLKSPLPIPIYLPTLSYTSYNFLHRWTGRTLFLTVTVHGGMWLNQFITTNQMDQVWAEKTKRGMIAYGLMGGVVLTSLKPVRRYCYQVFWVAQ